MTESKRIRRDGVGRSKSRLDLNQIADYIEENEISLVVWQSEFLWPIKVQEKSKNQKYPVWIYRAPPTQKDYYQFIYALWQQIEEQSTNSVIASYPGQNTSTVYELISGLDEEKDEDVLIITNKRGDLSKLNAMAALMNSQPEQTLFINTESASDAERINYSAIFRGYHVMSGKPESLTLALLNGATKTSVQAFLETEIKEPPLSSLPSHSIVAQDLEAWINAHSNEFRPAARLLSNCFRYVTYKQWLSTLLAVLDEWLHKTPIRQTWLWLPGEVDESSSVCKSNFWVAQIVVKYIQDKEPGRIVGVVSELYELETGSNLILCDDAAYSGLQL